MNFSSFGLDPSLEAALAGRGIVEASDIQKPVIPALLDTPGANLLFTAPTGTGKTLAYLLPLLTLIKRTDSGENRPGAVLGPRLLILAPTHELCSQIKRELDFLLGALEMGSSALLIGSGSLVRQIEYLKKKKPPGVVGNPARVLQLLHMKKLSLRGLRFLVLDEGDSLLAEELYEETAAVCAGVRKIPVRLISCSATFPPKSRDRLFALGNEAALKSPGSDSPAPSQGPGEAPVYHWKIIEETGASVLRRNIEHWAFFAEKQRKLSFLQSFLAAAKPKKTLVFCSRGEEAGKIVARLQSAHAAAGGIWGDMEKKARKAAIDLFRNGSLCILVASDLACRGLDMDGISHVVAMDVSSNPHTYLHRAGRTGRMGKRGVMVTIGDEAELRQLVRIEKKLGITVYPKELRDRRVVPCGEESP
ncbi:MAG: DEAD/DEAH box helicase [Spirochaetaceae bacterium]|jgi:superfamily II DNA/RNA helicase|nr:DEAD/DEAH box helicase [Spirochaetaceae bacterium]